MASIPHLITARSKSDSWLFEPDAETGTEALRDSCIDGVLEDEVFWQFGELPERMKATFMNALKAGDTTSNNAEVGRIIRAAFERAVSDALQMHVDRLEAEASMGGDRE